jgi:chorismate mutase
MPETNHPPQVMCRGVRGAITANKNSRADILSAIRKLLTEIAKANDLLDPYDIASVVFTTTLDLNAVYPAEAIREVGWAGVPILCTHEMSVPGGLARCIRVLVHWNSSLPANRIKHVYLGEAQKLRPDLSTEDTTTPDKPAGRK